MRGNQDSGARRVTDAEVGVVIATYNRASTIARAVRSALDQRGVRVEVVVVDDGSTDDTSLVLGEFGDAITVVRQENKERGAARNAGLTVSTAPVVAFLDSDDEMLPGHLAGLTDELRATDAGLAYSRAEWVREDGTVVWIAPQEPMEGDILRELAVENRLALSSALIERAVFESVGGFDEDRALSGAEDWELWVRVATVTPFANRPDISVRMHLHGANTVTNPTVMDRAVRQAVDRILAVPEVRELDIEREVRANALRTVARGYVQAGDVQQARRRVADTLRKRPGLLLDASTWRAILRSAVGPDRANPLT